MSYLRRGFIGAVLCLVLALAYQYMIAGSRAPLTKAATVATSAKVANMPRAPVIALSHGGGMNSPHHFRPQQSLPYLLIRARDRLRPKIRRY